MKTRIMRGAGGRVFGNQEHCEEFGRSPKSVEYFEGDPMGELRFILRDGRMGSAEDSVPALSQVGGFGTGGSDSHG